MQYPYFPLFVMDFSHGTKDMSAEEVGGYLLLLMHQWDKGGIPDDDKKLCKIARVKSKTLIEIRKKFKLEADGYLRNERLEIERSTISSKYSKLQSNGRLGGRPSKQKQKQKVSELKPNGSENETKHKPNGGENQNQNQNQNHTTADAVGPAAPTFVDPKSRLHPLAADTVAMQLMYYREDLSKEQAVIEARIMLDKVPNPGPGYIGEWAKNVKIKPPAGRSVIMDFMGSEVVWTEEEYRQYCAKQKDGASGYTFIRYEV